MIPNKHRVFVYGTLKRGNSLRGLDRMGDAEFVSESSTVDNKYNLWCLGAYPAVSVDGCNRIKGEVWEVDDAVFEQLDMIEGYPGFYNRQQIETEHGKAWMYYLASEDIKTFRIYRQLQGDLLEWNGD